MEERTIHNLFGFWIYISERDDDKTIGNTKINIGIWPSLPKIHRITAPSKRGFYKVYTISCEMTERYLQKRKLK